MPVRLVVLTAALSAASIAAASIAAVPALAHSAKGACSSGTATAKSSSYVLALRLGPQQRMYMPSEVTKKTRSGQVMLGGSMAMVDDAPAGMKIYDLAVYVCTKGGALVTQLSPAIVVAGAGAGAKPTHVAVAKMAAVGKGLSDYHYGNDVILKPGAKVTVTVSFEGERAVFHATVPKSGSGSDMGGMSMG
jgi:hypothetical protein